MDTPKDQPEAQTPETTTDAATTPTETTPAEPTSPAPEQAAPATTQATATTPDQTVTTQPTAEPLPPKVENFMQQPHAQQPLSPDSHHTKKFMTKLLVVLILILLIVALVLGYFITMGRTKSAQSVQANPQAAVPTTPPTATPTPNPTADWVTYSDKNISYSFNYPSNGKVKVAGKVLTLQLPYGGSDYQDFMTITSSNKQLIPPTVSNAANGSTTGTITSVDQSTVNSGNTVFTIYTVSCGTDCSYSVTQAKDGNTYYLFHFNVAGGGLEKTRDLVLQSFQLTSTTSASPTSEPSTVSPVPTK